MHKHSGWIYITKLSKYRIPFGQNHVNQWKRFYVNRDIKTVHFIRFFSYSFYSLNGIRNLSLSLFSMKKRKKKWMKRISLFYSTLGGMISKRTAAKTTYSASKCVSEMQSCSGSHFELCLVPPVVDNTRQILSSKHYHFNPSCFFSTNSFLQRKIYRKFHRGIINVKLLS